MNPFNINEVNINIWEGNTTQIICKHELSGIEVTIRRPRENAAILDMRAEALNEIKYLVKHSPRYARILKDAKETKNDQEHNPS